MDEKFLENVGSILQFALLIFCIVLAYLMWKVLYNRAIGLKRLTKTEKYDAKADWDEAKPVRTGLFRNAHWDVVVTFRDGSRYRTNLGMARGYGEPTYNDADMRAAIAEATTAHDFYEIDEKNKNGKKEFIEDVKDTVVSSAIFSAACTIGLPLVMIVGAFLIMFISTGIRGCVGMIR